MNDAMPLEPRRNNPPPEASLTLGELQKNYLDTFYATLFHPVQAFRLVAEAPQPGNHLLFYALVSVILISTLAPVLDLVHHGGPATSLVITMPFSAVTGVLVWLLTALVVSFLAYAFTGQTRIRTFMTLSGLATLPWLLMGPVSLLQIGIGTVGLILTAILGMGVWLWSIVLFALALTATYRMTAERVLIVLAMPLVMGIVFIGWVLGFINNVNQLLPPDWRF